MANVANRTVAITNIAMTWSSRDFNCPEVCDRSDRETWPARQLFERLLQRQMTQREAQYFERHRGLSSGKPPTSFNFAPRAPRSSGNLGVLFELIAERERKSIALNGQHALLAIA